MKYKCLVLDHDDTVVSSSATIHYPSFIAYLEDYRPELVKNYTFESFIIKNFDPGIVSLLADEVGAPSLLRTYSRERAYEGCGYYP